MNRALTVTKVMGYNSMPILHRLVHVVVTVSLIFEFATAAGQQSRVRENLNAGWLFERQAHGGGALGSFDRSRGSAEEIEPRFAGVEKDTYDDSSWDTIDLPHTWNAFDVSDEESGYWRGIGWYRKHFSIDKKYAGKRIALEFEGANQTAEVWLNGRLVGTHKGGYTGFSFEVTPRLGEDNVLTVKVDNLFDGTVPPTVKTDYSFYGGIYRSVSLVITDPAYVSDMYWTTPSVSQTEAQVEYHSQITNSTGRPVQLTLRQQVTDSQGSLADSTEVPVLLASGETKSITQKSKPIANPKLWSPHAPNLYRIHTSLMDGSKVIDDLETPLGFRWYNFDPERGLIINGKRIQIQGTNWHQSYPGLGNALPKSRNTKDIEEMRAMGANFWRTSHYPHDVSTLDASDRLGMMVWEELPINKEIGNVSEYTKNAVNMAHEMIQRDRNHPSILVWGFAGEVNAPTAVAKSVVKTVATTYRQLDPTRPVGMHSPRGEEIEALVDIVGASAGPETDQKHIEHPDRAYMEAEYSAALIARGRYGNGHASEDIALERHEKALGEINSRPWMAGGCIWNQFDYDGETYDAVIPHVVSFGMEDVWRIPKEVYYFYQSQWAEKPMVHIVGHWTWPGQEGKTRLVKVYSNEDNVELFLNGRSLGSKMNLAAAGLRYPPRIWKVPYEPGTLRAVGSTESASVTDEQKTAGPAYKLILTVDTPQVTSGDLDSLAYITASVTDDAGVVVPGAHPAITFTSYGPGHLLKQSWLGHGTGYTWEAIDGTTRVAFRSTPRSGRAVISAYSPGLETGQVSILVTAPGKPDEMNYKELFTDDELN